MAAKKENKTESVVVRLTAQDLQALEHLSQVWGCSVAEAVRKAVQSATLIEEMAALGGQTVPPARRKP